MPTPASGESEQAFVSRCIEYLMGTEGETDPAHAAAKCHGIYRQSKKEADMPKTMSTGRQGVASSSLGSLEDELREGLPEHPPNPLNQPRPGDIDWEDKPLKQP